jgi:hypothetical protein
MKIEAFRPERWRYLRLLDLLEEVNRAAAALDPRAWSDEPLEELSDRKGDFTATWADEASARRFHSLVDELWFRLDPDSDEAVHGWTDAAGAWQQFSVERRD